MDNTTQQFSAAERFKKIQLKQLLKRLSCGILILDVELTIRFANQFAASHLEKTTKEIVDLPIQLLFPNFNTDKLNDYSAINNSTELKEKVFFLRTDNAFEVLNLSISAIYEGKLLCGWVCTFSKNASAGVNLPNFGEHYRRLFNSANDIIIAIEISSEDGIGKIVDANKATCQLLGFSHAELIEQSAETLFPDWQRNTFQQKIETLFTLQQSLFETKLLTKDGNTLPVEINAKVIELNSRPTITAICRDISARKRAQKQLKEQAVLLEKAQDAIIVFDMNHHISFWNNSAERLYGWQQTAAIGENILKLLFPNENKTFQDARKVLVSTGEWHGELRQVTKTGEDIIVLSRWSLIQETSSAPQRILVVNTDITEQKQLEVQFLRAQRMESIGSLSGGIAHDLNNVLSPILTAVEVLRARLSADERTQKVLNTIESNVMRGSAMLKQILSFARGIEGEYNLLNIAHMISEIEKIIRETFPKSIQINVHFPQDLWLVNGDVTQLHQVLLNLCLNARDAMPDGGELTIFAEDVELTATESKKILDASSGNFVRISVYDSGMGIPKAIVSKIFEPFFSTKGHDKGTGLGLSTAAAIIKSHNGFINVLSEKNRGSRFDIYLPALQADYDFQDNKEEIEVPNGSGECILVVDDEPSILEIAQMSLEAHGYNVKLANDGAEAVEIFTQNKSNISLVLTDMMMPIMDGMETIKNIRKLSPKTPIIASSGFVEDPRVKSFIQNGAEAFLQKPYTSDTLISLIYDKLHHTSV